MLFEILCGLTAYNGIIAGVAEETVAMSTEQPPNVVGTAIVVNYQFIYRGEGQADGAGFALELK